MAESSQYGKKTLWEKEELLVTSNFSFTHSILKRPFLQTRENQGLFGKGLKSEKVWGKWRRTEEWCLVIDTNTFCYVIYYSLNACRSTKLVVMQSSSTNIEIKSSHRQLLNEGVFYRIHLLIIPFQNKSFTKGPIYAQMGLSVKCVKTTPINSCHWNCSIPKGRFKNCLKHNSEKELLQIWIRK